ncbi:hypothetical protein NE237_025299 [Protea cynaroides]|uniref:Uncharacterized protein n=1 Tax=Protea cynaroides TaxID=273540 RepID=A0A9Q0K1M2_9MAGN|nr:hypothetical protein NE237_025299 [Protea cynaroides]
MSNDSNKYLKNKIQAEKRVLLDYQKEEGVIFAWLEAEVVRQLPWKLDLGVVFSFPLSSFTTKRRRCEGRDRKIKKRMEKMQRGKTWARKWKLPLISNDSNAQGVFATFLKVVTRLF